MRSATSAVRKSFLAQDFDARIHKSDSLSFSVQAQEYVRKAFEGFDRDSSKGLSREEFSSAFFAIARAAPDYQKEKDEKTLMSLEDFSDFVSVLPREVDAPKGELDLKGFTSLLLSYYFDDASTEAADRRLECFFASAKAIPMTPSTAAPATVADPITPPKVNLMDLLRPKKLVKPGPVLNISPPPLPSKARDISGSTNPPQENKPLHPFFLKPKKVITLDSPVKIESDDKGPSASVVQDNKPAPSPEEVARFLSKFPGMKKTGSSSVSDPSHNEDEAEAWPGCDGSIYPDGGWSTAMMDFPNSHWPHQMSPLCSTSMHDQSKSPAASTSYPERRIIAEATDTSSFSLTPCTRVPHSLWHRRTIVEPLNAVHASPSTEFDLQDSVAISDDDDGDSESEPMPKDPFAWLHNENTVRSPSELFSTVYRARSLSQLLHRLNPNKEALSVLLEWMTQFHRSTAGHNAGGAKRRKVEESDESDLAWGDTDEEDDDERSLPMVLVGPNGSGKTSAVYACAESLGMVVLESNASDDRTGLRLTKQLIGEASSSKSIAANGDGATLRSTVLLVDEAHIGFDEDPVNFIASLRSLIKSSKCPIVIVFDETLPAAISDNGETMQSGSVLGNSRLVKFRLPSSSSKDEFTRQVARNEGIASSVKANGTCIRQALMDLQLKRGDPEELETASSEVVGLDSILSNLSRSTVQSETSSGEHQLPWELTPRVLSVAPNYGKEGDSIIILGSFPFFDKPSLVDVSASIGGAPCYDVRLVSEGRLSAKVGRVPVETKVVPPASPLTGDIGDDDDVFETNAFALLSSKAKRSGQKKPLELTHLPLDVSVQVRLRLSNGAEVTLRSDDQPETRWSVLFQAEVSTANSPESSAQTISLDRQRRPEVDLETRPAPGDLEVMGSVLDEMCLIEAMLSRQVSDGWVNECYDGVRESSHEFAECLLRSSIPQVESRSNSSLMTRGMLAPLSRDLLEFDAAAPSAPTSLNAAYRQDLRRVGLVEASIKPSPKQTWVLEVPFSLIMARQDEVARLDCTKRRFTSHYRAGFKDAKRAARVGNTLYRSDYDRKPEDSGATGREYEEGVEERELV